MDTVFSSITSSCSPSPSPRDSASTGLRSWLYQEAPNVPTNSRLYIHAQGRTRVVLNQQAYKHHSTFSIKEVDTTGAISMTAKSDHQAGLVLPSALSPTGRHSEVHHVTELAPVAQDRGSEAKWVWQRSLIPSHCSAWESSSGPQIPKAPSLPILKQETKPRQGESNGDEVAAAILALSIGELKE